ncbi:MAG: peptidoglycan DD-metalloendopeptidase family protein [Bacteroidales bacterium]|jgi:murein DD-endopeptidase MepM/ murein hydrolase activator NlpD|nr:peptidoglycan DD-metalloendopeptidase family protein [Bacteroidales bacterium]MDD4617606.1 peptidoglycan DD-metalloendopeptidase family protein [Bacteroidales bacterium]
MKRLVYSVFAMLLIAACANENETDLTVPVSVVQEEVYEFGFPVSEFDSKEGVIKRGDFFATLATRLGASAADAYALSQASEDVFDLKTIKVGNGYKAFYTREEEPSLAYLVYEDTRTRYVVFGLHDSLFVRVDERGVSSTIKYGEAVINSSLWNDVSDAGMNPLLALRLSEIYAWSVDFFGLRKGDSFKVLYEELYVGDQFFDIGTIHSAVFRHAGKDYDAFRFIQDQIPQYWNEKGENLKKAFLKAPLSFTRISSGFSYARRHPVTRVVRPHTGIDYAAPTGTPVMSIGDGVVTQRAYTRGGGNQVKIRHNSTYTTAYLHLSRFAKGLSVGKRVRQGEVIGYVGSTGLSTGPHLDFRVWKNGSPINPLRMESPPADPLKEENKELFAASMQRAKQLRDSVISVQYLDTILLTIGLDASVVYAR